MEKWSQIIMGDIENNDLEILIHNAHGVAHSKGFWDKARTPSELLMLIVTELAEAAEELRKVDTLGYNTIYYVPGSGKPEGFSIEIADACLRIFDMVGGFKIDIITAYQRMTKIPNNLLKDISQIIIHSSTVDMTFGNLLDRSLPLENLMNIVSLTGAANSQYKKPGHFQTDAFAVSLAKVLFGIFRICDIYQIDLGRALLTKLNYNKTRDFMHGKKI